MMFCIVQVYSTEHIYEPDARAGVSRKLDARKQIIWNNLQNR